MISKHTFYSLFIPSLLFLIFSITYPLLNIKETKHKCTYVNNSICVSLEKDKDTIKNIDLNKYEINTKDLKVNEEITYKIDTIEYKRNLNYSLALLFCLILFICIRFPQIFNILVYL